MVCPSRAYEHHREESLVQDPSMIQNGVHASGLKLFMCYMNEWLLNNTKCLANYGFLQQNQLFLGSWEPDQQQTLAKKGKIASVGLSPSGRLFNSVCMVCQ